jgi:hypothetical protein
MVFIDKPPPLVFFHSAEDLDNGGAANRGSPLLAAPLNRRSASCQSRLRIATRRLTRQPAGPPARRSLPQIPAFQEER